MPRNSWSLAYTLSVDAVLDADERERAAQLPISPVVPKRT